MRLMGPEATHHYLTRDDKNIHNRWNKDIEPVLRIESGDLVTMETRDASDGHFSPESTRKDTLTRDTSKIHPLTGPIYVNGAKPKDVLRIDILDYEPNDWGWSVTGKNKGMLPDLLPEDYFKVWTCDRNNKYVYFNDKIRVKMAPFLGTMGVAWEEPGEFRTAPPRKNGGNMDIRYLTPGTTLYLPVFVEGGLFSAGDGHAAQGDAEASGSAIEIEMTATLRITVVTESTIEEPRYETDHYYATTGFGTSIIEASQKAVRAMVAYIASNYRLSTEEAYVLTTAAMDLKICEAVNMPHYLVSAHVPKEIFL